MNVIPYLPLHSIFQIQSGVSFSGSDKQTKLCGDHWEQTSVDLGNLYQLGLLCVLCIPLPFHKDTSLVSLVLDIEYLFNWRFFQSLLDQIRFLGKWKLLILIIFESVKNVSYLS